MPARPVQNDRLMSEMGWGVAKSENVVYGSLSFLFPLGCYAHSDPFSNDHAHGKGEPGNKKGRRSPHVLTFSRHGNTAVASLVFAVTMTWDGTRVGGSASCRTLAKDSCLLPLNSTPACTDVLAYSDTV